MRVHARSLARFSLKMFEGVTRFGVSIRGSVLLVGRACDREGYQLSAIISMQLVLGFLKTTREADKAG